MPGLKVGRGGARFRFVKDCPVALAVGVAVDPGKGGPSMRLFKVRQVAKSEEDRARDLRLTSIASKYRAGPEAAAPAIKSQ